MLVLTRRTGERIVINDQIVLEVLHVKGNRIRLGIQAPPGCTILRQELLTRPAEVELAKEPLPTPDFISPR
jgi:carbon storage regulator